MGPMDPFWHPGRQLPLGNFVHLCQRTAAKLTSAHVETLKQLIKDTRAIDSDFGVGTIKKWYICDPLCPPFFPRSRNSELAALFSRTVSGLGCISFKSPLLSSPALGMVAEKGWQPGKSGGGAPWLGWSPQCCPGRKGPGVAELGLL